MSADPGDGSTLDTLLAATTVLERRLEAAGETRAHEWMFALREVLLDVRRWTGSVAEALDAEGSIADAPARLQGVARMLLYEVLPHVGDHARELEESLSATPADHDTPTDPSP